MKLCSVCFSCRPHTRGPSKRETKNAALGICKVFGEQPPKRFQHQGCGLESSQGIISFSFEIRKVLKEASESIRFL